MQSSYRYWCFACQRHFQAQAEAKDCPLCHSQAIELAANNNNDPSNFTAYQIQPQTLPLQQPQHTHNLIQNVPPHFHPFNPLAFQAFNSQNLALGIPPPGGRPQVNYFQMSLNLNNVFQTFQQLVGREHGIFNLLNSLMGQGNLVAATQQEISRLQNVDKVVECSICQEEENEQERKKGYKLLCGHTFHIDCLNPWLQRTNTCPTCRSHI